MKKLISILFLLVTYFATAQNPQPIPNGVRTPFIIPTTVGKLGINTNSPQAALDITSTANGILIPRMTTTQKNAISSPHTSEMVYDTTIGGLSGFQMYNGTSWVSIAGGVGSSVESVSGDLIDNSDPANPIVNTPDWEQTLAVNNVVTHGNDSDFFRLENSSNSDSHIIVKNTDVGQPQINLDGTGSSSIFNNTVFSIYDAPFGSGRLVNYSQDKIYYSPSSGIINEIKYPSSATSTSEFIPISVNGEFADSEGNIIISGGGAVDSVNGQTGTVVLNQDNIGDGTTYKQYSATEKTKLAGIATGATANDTDANLKNRANHTGTQSAATISDFNTAVATTAALKSNNLSDLASASTARTNLGLGTLATQSGTFSGTSSGTNTGDQTITLTGAVTGSGTGSFATTLSSGIDATKVGDGSVTTSEFQFINTLTSNAQTQIDTKQATNTAANFGAFSSALTAKTTPVDADTVNISDSAASGDAKKLTLTNFWTNYFKSKADALYLTIASPTFTGLLSGTGTTQTGSSAIGIVDLTTTLNTTGSPTLFKINFTNTASGTTTKFVDFQAGGVSQFNVSKAGFLTIKDGIVLGSGGSQINSTSGGVFALYSDSGSTAASRITFGTADSSAPALAKNGGDLALLTGNASAYINLTLAGIQTAYTAKTANYTIVSRDYTVNCTTNTFTVTLPTAVSVAGKIYVINNSGTGVITVATTSSQTIDGSTTKTLSTQYSNVTVQSDGANWIILSIK